MSSACPACVILTQDHLAKPCTGLHPHASQCHSAWVPVPFVPTNGWGDKNTILTITLGCHGAGTKPRGGVGGIRRAVLNPVVCQALLWVLLGSILVQTLKLPVLLPGMVLSWALYS